MTPDSELLRQFARIHSEAAFAELIHRHVNLVYSAALRQVNGDAHLAQDVAQTVFTDLARKADSLARGRDASSPLTGWLYTAAHHAAAKMVRGENRRRDREEKFMREPNETAPEADWEKLRPTLDAAMHELKETDRDAILLRYFENQPFIQVGAKLGLNENAARMRVERALEKLRDNFARRGITTATSLASVISANAIQIAPANLGATMTTASIAAAGTGTFTLLKIMTATKLKLAFSALVVAGATTAFVIQRQAQEKLRAENESLARQLAQLQADNESLSNRVAAIDNSKKLSDEQFNELLKLRGVETRLRTDANVSNDPFVQMALAWKARIEKLKKLFEQEPNLWIPEVQFVTDQEWLDIAISSDFDSDDGVRYALSRVRLAGEQHYASMMQKSLNKFIEANNGNLPTDISQLKPFFNPPTDDTLLQRYRLLNSEDQNASWLEGGVVVEKSVVDKVHDNLFVVGPQRIGIGPGPESLHLTFPKELIPVMQSYQSQNNKQTPKDFAELKPYVTTPEQEAALDKLINTLKQAQAP